mgnify:CR=1 FL=1
MPEFQFTRPRGARRAARPCWPSQPSFQFTRPRGARHTAAVTINKNDLFQFTRPRGARPAQSGDAHQAARFNSRAREGRDAVNHGNVSAREVSIHAPARGATRRVSVKAQKQAFQFTRPRGARRTAALLRYFPPVSIHAPARGATWAGGEHFRLGGFNSRAREGRDKLRFPPSRPSLFQFTRPRGARPAARSGNSTAPGVSIHAPARGAT